MPHPPSSVPSGGWNRRQWNRQLPPDFSGSSTPRTEPPDTAQSEANYFLQAIKNHNINTNAVVVCDYEAGSGSAGSSQINAFYQVLENAGYKNVCIYSSRSWFQGQRKECRLENRLFPRVKRHGKPPQGRKDSH